MAVFAYAARDSKGALVEGSVSANSPADAAKILRGEGKVVVRVTPKSGKAAKPAPAATGKTRTSAQSPGGALIGSLSFSQKDKYRPDDLIYFTNQLAVMVETGVSLSEALSACVDESNSPRFARALDGVIESVEGGSEFSGALADYPRVFPTIYVSLIRASEASGLLGPMLRRLSMYLEAQREMKKKIKGAITYPIVMFFFAIGVTIFLMTFVLPKFAAIYVGREDKLPFITRWLMSFSNALTSYGLYILAGLAAAVVGAVFYFRTPKGKVQLESVRLRTPLIGPLCHKTYLTRSLRTLGTMIQSGVSILDGIRLTSTVCNSLYYEKMWLGVAERLETGQQISEALSDNKYIPRAVNKMLSAGERSGQLGPVMERVATFCEAELNVAIKTMTSLLEPAIVMFLGTVVGGLVLALLLPIFTISKAMH